MKKIGFFLSLIVAFVALLVIGPGEAHSKNSLTIGASNVPHAQILNHIKPELEKEGIHLNIRVFQDYVLPNKALASGELDANYFQTIPFLNQWNKQNNGHLVDVGAVHLEPMGIYSKKVKRLQDLKDNATILVSNNAPDYGRILQLFQQAGLIKIKKGVSIEQANFSDIVSNPKHLKFKTGYEPKLLPEIYENGEGDAVAINANYAVQSGLNPKKQAIALQKSDPHSPYNNIVAVRKEDRNNPQIKKLMKILESKPVQKWIYDHYKGGVVPAHKY
ncbi:MetQ/NlpA family ABC transporter substrate-binding protein [Lactobacillus sp. Sy-1]|uniref:MetQ/NlpA family ABC transporter substrate-binding protein n=1 Tax=Lactobacillus sp. Sy-1 TaxID=2109645 RepID=UPI001C5BC3B5|nr:MetQ/NlpA family ABC transporter substrate-binding protein [Lactobacillus sp. Sy-1]MBW1605827.1 MetQ/NlpA family ABC transporter substrate-binding protein [Lactobacillus sp. Sy-1]